MTRLRLVVLVWLFGPAAVLVLTVLACHIADRCDRVRHAAEQEHWQRFSLKMRAALYQEAREKELLDLLADSPEDIAFSAADAAWLERQGMAL